MTNSATNTKRRQLDSLKHRQRMLQLFLFFMITIMIWVFFSLARSSKRTQIDPALQKLATPLTPTIDETAIQELEQKRHYRPAELVDFPIYKIVISKRSGEERIVKIDSGIDSLDELEVEPVRQTNGGSDLGSLTETEVVVASPSATDEP